MLKLADLGLVSEGLCTLILSCRSCLEEVDGGERLYTIHDGWWRMEWEDALTVWSPFHGGKRGG